MIFAQWFDWIGFNVSTALSACSICILIHHLLRRDRRNLPPTPGIRLPVIGHMHHLQEDLRKPFRKIRREKGDLYTLHLGARLTIVISGYKALKEAFVKNAEVFSDRPKFFTLEAVTQGKGFVNESGPQWKEHRRFVLKTLKDLGMGRRALEGIVQKEASKLVQLIKDTKEEPFYPRPMINQAVANIISSMIFGETFEYGEPRIGEMLAIVEENLKYHARAGVLNFFPFLTWLPGDLFKLQKVVSNSLKVHQFCTEIVMKHQQASDGRAAEDFTIAYLRELEAKTSTGEDTTFSLDNLSGTIADLFFAGSETTTTALNWCIVCMVEYPEIQQKLYDEIMKTVGDSGTVCMADKPKLAYLEAFYIEVLRFCQIVPVLPLHATSRDTQLMGYTIPKEAMIFIDLDSVLSDPNIWGDPEKFRPERFLDENKRLTKADEYIAFFFGKRSCIGEALARMELFLTLSCLIQQFEFVCPDNETLTYSSVDGVFGTAHAPKPFRVIARQRK